MLELIRATKKTQLVVLPRSTKCIIFSCPENAGKVEIKIMTRAVRIVFIENKKKKQSDSRIPQRRGILWFKTNTVRIESFSGE